MRTSLILLAAGLAVSAAQARAAQAEATLAAAAFRDICLASAPDAGAARSAAASAGFQQGATLPGVGGGAALETYARPPLELAIRATKKGDLGCLILFEMRPGQADQAVADAITALPGVTLLSGKGNAKSFRGTWTPVAAPKGSKIYLTINDRTGTRSAILTLESKAKK